MKHVQSKTKMWYTLLLFIKITLRVKEKKYQKVLKNMQQKFNCILTCQPVEAVFMLALYDVEFFLGGLDVLYWWVVDDARYYFSWVNDIL